MKRILFTLALAGAMSVLPGQTEPSTQSQAPPSAPPSSSSTAAQPGATSGSQTLMGVLMDADCQVIQSSRSTAGSSNPAQSAMNTTTSSPAQGDVKTYSGSSSSQSSTSATSSTNTTGSEQRASSSATAAPAAAPTPTPAPTASSSASTTSSSRPTEDQGQRTGDTGERSRSATATTSSSANATETTAATSATATTPGDTSSSSADTMSSFTAVREKYSQCMVKPTSAAFAIHSDGRLYIFDSAGNDMVRQQMANEAFRAAMNDANGAPKWMSVTVIGTPDASSNQLAVTSIRK